MARIRPRGRSLDGRCPSAGTLSPKSAAPHMFLFVTRQQRPLGKVPAQPSPGLGLRYLRGYLRSLSGLAGPRGHLPPACHIPVLRPTSQLMQSPSLPNSVSVAEAKRSQDHECPV